MGPVLQVLAGGAIAGPMQELAARFERDAGRKVVLRFGTTPDLIKLATSGDPFDLGVTPRDVFKDPDARAQFVLGPTIDIARVGLGVAVRAGAPRPDIGTPDALRQALLAAQSIATIPASAGGYATRRAFERLGIGEAVQARIRGQAGPAELVAAVAKGEAELGVFLLNVLTAPGLDVVGPFPAELQEEVTFTAAVAANASEPVAARAFIAYLTSPDVKALFRARGLTPS